MHASQNGTATVFETVGMWVRILLRVLLTSRLTVGRGTLAPAVLVRIQPCHLLQSSLTVGQRTLNPFVVVRIHPLQLYRVSYCGTAADF